MASWKTFYHLELLLLIITCVQDGITADYHVRVLFENGYESIKSVISQTLAAEKEKNSGLQFSLVDFDPKTQYTPEQLCGLILSDPLPSIVINTIRVPGSIYQPLSKLVRSFLKQQKIPTLDLTFGWFDDYQESGWTGRTPEEREYLVHVTPPNDLYTQSIRDFCSQNELDTAGILYDSTIILDYKYARLLENIPTRHILRFCTQDVQDLENKTNVIRSTDVTNFFVVGTIQHLENALNTAEKLGLKTREHMWFLITRETGEPKCKSCKNMKYIFISPVDRNNNRITAPAPEDRIPVGLSSMLEAYFYHDITKYLISVVSEKFNSGEFPTTLEFGKCPSKAPATNRDKFKLLSALQAKPFQGKFGPIVVRNDPPPADFGYQDFDMKVQEIKIGPTGTPEATDLATWTYGDPSGKFVMKEGQSEDSLKKLAAVTVYRVVTIIQPPFITRRNTSDGGPEFEGYCIDLIDSIKEIMKFEYTIYEVPDGEFGTLNNVTREWNGMMRELVDKKADIAIGPIAVMAERETVVDFTVPYYDLVGLSILMKKPEVKPSLFKFLTVLEANVWGCILAAYFFTSFLMYIFDRLSPYSYRNNKEKYKDDDDKREFTLKECLWFCMTSLTPQGGGEAPRNLSGRLVAATWWLFGFIIIASYTANLAAFLTVSRLESPIESLDDLSKQYKIKYAPQKDTTAMTYFQRMANIEEKFYDIWKNMSLDDNLDDVQRAELAVWDYPVSDKFTKMWWTMTEAKMPETHEEGIARVKASSNTEGFAFIAEATQVKYATMTNCDLVQVGSEFSRKPLALAVQQNSPLKDQLSSAILKLLNQRKLESLKEQWWNKNPNRVDCGEEDNQSDGISIKNIGGVFIVIFIGVVMACITLTFEYFYYKNKKPRSKVINVKERRQGTVRTIQRR